MIQNSAWQLLSMGNSISTGVYSRIHSAHPHAVNFVRGDQVYTVCARSISPGPTRIVIDTDNVQHITETRIGSEWIILDQTTKIEILPSRMYNSPQFPKAGQAFLRKMIQSAAAEFFSICSPDSAAGLMMLKDRTFGDFLGILAVSFRRGLHYLRKKEWEKGIICFKGKGLGFTPAGDDFLLGFITGLAWLERILEKDWSGSRAKILELSLGRDPLLNSFLRQAAELALDQDWAEFLLHLQQPQGDHHARHDRIMATGSTSGEDTLSGFYHACDILQ